MRIITLSKFNAHTDPLFKTLKLLKVIDLLTIQALKTYYKFKHNKLPIYLQTWALVSNDSIHSHNTRDASALHIFRSKPVFANSCLRHKRVGVNNVTSQCILDKLHTHSMQGFLNYAKNSLLQAYQDRRIENC